MRCPRSLVIAVAVAAPLAGCNNGQATIAAPLVPSAASPWASTPVPADETTVAPTGKATATPAKPKAKPSAKAKAKARATSGPSAKPSSAR